MAGRTMVSWGIPIFGLRISTGSPPPGTYQDALDFLYGRFDYERQVMAAPPASRSDSSFRWMSDRMRSDT